MAKIYVICSVRNGDPELQKRILNYAEKLEQQGHIVHVPFRNTNQDDPIGINITQEHELQDILWADKVIAFWNPLSEGSWYDLAQVRMEQQFRKLEIIFFDPQSLSADSQNPVQLQENQIPRSPLAGSERNLLERESIIIEWLMDLNDVTRVYRPCLWTFAQARIMAHHDLGFSIEISNIARLKHTPHKSYTNVAICTHYGWTAPLTAEDFLRKCKVFHH